MKAEKNKKPIQKEKNENLNKKSKKVKKVKVGKKLELTKKEKVQVSQKINSNKKTSAVWKRKFYCLCVNRLGKAAYFFKKYAHTTKRREQ